MERLSGGGAHRLFSHKIGRLLWNVAELRREIVQGRGDRGAEIVVTGQDCAEHIGTPGFYLEINVNSLGAVDIAVGGA